MNRDDILKHLDNDELTIQASDLIAWEIGAVDNIDDVANFMYKGGQFPPLNATKLPDIEKLIKNDKRPERKYWYAVKREFFLFLCSENDKYAELWNRLGKLENKSTTSIVTTISAYMGSKLGVEAGIISGFCSVCLYGAMKIGKEALCRYIRENNA